MVDPLNKGCGFPGHSGKAFRNHLSVVIFLDVHLLIGIPPMRFYRLERSRAHIAAPIKPAFVPNSAGTMAT
jgi:hypothetical protein